jgi:ADP-ribosylglycohydrolase
MDRLDRATGCLFGLAYGDALGAPTEFMTYDGIVGRYGPAGPDDLPEPALVTDDTQMTLAVAGALLDALAEPPLRAATLEPRLRDRYVVWLRDPENNRAPGTTCLRACERLEAGVRWAGATVAGSKGCGANMRVAPVGLVPGLTDGERAGAAQLQAAMTHGHPTALAASELTALAVHLLRTGTGPDDLLAALRDRCAEQRTVYREDWLGDLCPAGTGPATFMARGWDECAAALDTVRQALAGDDEGDPCALTGAGWIAEEALATALYCFLGRPEEPVQVLSRAAATSGDSDSIACLAGAFAGAWHGMDAWPPAWADRIEYHTDLTHYGRAWDRPSPRAPINS